MELKDEIKKRFKKLPNDGAKTEFIEYVAFRVGRSPLTIRQHWFCDYGFWSIPKKHQNHVLELLNEFEQQNKKVA